jgi:Na+/melibiose symporter-like transporter
MILGAILIIIALILGIVQHTMTYNFYGDEANKWYFYGIVAIIGIIGIIAAAWAYIKK